MLFSFSSFNRTLSISQRRSVQRAPLNISCTQTNRSFQATEKTQVPSPWVLLCQPRERAGGKNGFNYETGVGKQEKSLPQAQNLCVAKLEFAPRSVEQPGSPLSGFLVFVPRALGGSSSAIANGA